VLELDRRIKEQDDLVARLEELESTTSEAGQKGGRRWGT
jgi:hypothetical protein